MAAAFYCHAQRRRVAPSRGLSPSSSGLFDLFCAEPYSVSRFGEQYARMLLILSMVVMYSISCPLITPFGMLLLFLITHTDLTGLVYFVFKHLVDKHNLAFVYERSNINKNVHRSGD